MHSLSQMQGHKHAVNDLNARQGLKADDFARIAYWRQSFANRAVPAPDPVLLVEFKDGTSSRMPSSEVSNRYVKLSIIGEAWFADDIARITAVEVEQQAGA